MLPVYVLTNDKHTWLLPGFCYLFNTFWPGNQPVTIAGYSQPTITLPDNFSFISLAPENFPANRWSNGLLKMLEIVPGRHFILFLEDYWLNAPVDVARIERLAEWMKGQKGILRLDLSGERAAKKQARRVVPRRTPIPLVETGPGSPFQMSFQVNIWTKRLLYSALKPGETPWEAEVHGSERLVARPELRVLGVAERAISYSPVYRTHRGRLELSKVPGGQVNYMRQQGWI